MGGVDSSAMEILEKNMQKLPEVLTQNSSLMKEAFAQAAKQSSEANKDTPAERNATSEGKPNASITPEKKKTSTEKEPDEEDKEKTETESPSKEEPKVDKDNPKIEDDEEEIIDTNPKKKKQEPEEEEKVAPGQEEDDEAEYLKDEFRAPWENLEVASTIFEKVKAMHEDPEEFEQINWNLKADILERQADLEIAREAIQDGIDLYKKLIDLCVKHNLDRAKSRTIAGILYKIG
jgi:hypothetical protein